MGALYKAKILESGNSFSCGDDSCIGSEICCSAFGTNSCMEKEDCLVDHPSPPTDWCEGMCSDQCLDSIFPAYCYSACMAGCHWDN